MIISLRLIALVHLILLLFLMPLFYMSTPIVDYIDTSSRYRQLVQNLHKLQIMARPITTNSTPCPPLLLLATAPIPPVPHNSVNGQPKCWIHLPGRDMFWIRIGLLMGKSLMKITSTIWFPKYRKSAPASAAFTRKLRIFMLLP